MSKAKADPEVFCLIHIVLFFKMNLLSTFKTQKLYIEIPHLAFLNESTTVADPGRQSARSGTSLQVTCFICSDYLLLLPVYFCVMHVKIQASKYFLVSLVIYCTQLYYRIFWTIRRTFPHQIWEENGNVLQSKCSLPGSLGRGGGVEVERVFFPPLFSSSKT